MQTISSRRKVILATAVHPPRFTKRYGTVTSSKATGETYTPATLADFVANQIVKAATFESDNREISIFDPAAGDGELLLALAMKIRTKTIAPLAIYAFDTKQEALTVARSRIEDSISDVSLHFAQESFLDFMIRHAPGSGTLFTTAHAFPSAFDLIIANPPYVRTQILGAKETQRLAQEFGLSGRVDLYHAFLLGIGSVLKQTGTAGIIVSNRFMTTKGGAGVRSALKERVTLRHVWDLGDTKLFDAAVLPAVILANGRRDIEQGAPFFSSIYETTDIPAEHSVNALEALQHSGIVGIPDGRSFKVQHGTLAIGETADSIWRISTDSGDEWLETVQGKTWGTFREIGKVRVGVKTCADKVFISSSWSDLPTDQTPELLRPLTTHHIAKRFRAGTGKNYSILYPHSSSEGKRGAIDLEEHPKSRAYLEQHRSTLEARTYLMDGGRRWYELWVPQDPAAWKAPKLVFRDISERPTFWLDLDGTIVNGDCYWLTADKEGGEDLLWLAAAVANSTFIEAFYDHRFNNKLYSGRRRFITQYVELFPLPDPSLKLSREIIAGAKFLYEQDGSSASPLLETKLDELVWQAFGLRGEEVRG
jgi:adenine-specific DNA-methyltransferase